MSEINFYTLDESERKNILEKSLGNKGKIISTSGGMCGDIYIFDQGKHVSPRYICAKVPKLSDNCSKAEADARFINELKKQLSFYHDQFVHWAFDFKEVMGAPVALFRYWGSDLDKLMNESSMSHIQKLSIMAYICAGLIHCYKNGLVSHQDLKPENIFIRDIKDSFIGLPDFDIYMFALVADFGLANAFIDSQKFDGSRPYMAPEQWSESALSSKTDVFALGVIFFQLMTEGYHPIGIKLREYWPKPIIGHSKKWTKKELWEKWSKKDEKISKEISSNINSDVLVLIQEMLSTSPVDRPSMKEVLKKILILIGENSLESYNQIHMLINYFNAKVSSDSLEEQWPYLAHSWKRFESKFGGSI